jgi:hypothetical protein
MFRELQVDTSELEKLKGISIGMTNDDQQFLVFTYEKRKMSERVLVLVWWLVFAVLYGACGFAIWWYLVR